MIGDLCDLAHSPTARAPTTSHSTPIIYFRPLPYNILYYFFLGGVELLFYALFSASKLAFQAFEIFVFSAVLSYFLYFFENFILLPENSGVKYIDFPTPRKKYRIQLGNKLISFSERNCISWRSCIIYYFYCYNLMQNQKLDSSFIQQKT